MKIVVCFFVLVLVLTQNACLFRKEQVDGLWFYTYKSGADLSDDLAATPASFIQLLPDKTYTRYYAGFDFGQWERKDSLLLLRSLKGKTVSFPIRLLMGNELQLVTRVGNIVHFEKQPGIFSSDSQNPFSIENNHWRIPAMKKETDAQLKNRLRNHCRFYELYFSWALEQKLNSINVNSTPSSIKIYSNGFGLKEYEDLPKEWRSYFFDEEDCRKANEIIRDIFRHGNLGWSQTENKFKMFISAFQQMQELLK
jgi:hypothetical protein